MPHSKDTSFTPEEVDQQIEHYLSDQSDAPTEHAERQAILSIKCIYGMPRNDDAPSLERVWQRVLASEAPTAPEQEASQPGVLSLRPKGRRQTLRRRSLIVELAVALCLVLIVSSFAWINIHSSHVLQPSVMPIRSESGLYTYQNQTVYRLDSQTHKILWQRTFANNEFVDAQTGYSNEPKPFAVGENLYVTTQLALHPDQQYLYALNINDGSILWKLPTTSWAFATSEAVYTVAESTTSDISTLTAYSPQTGKQLWQHQYDIVGSKSAVGLGTATTEGFRLLAVNDQVLYAVVSYHLNGQDFFARYGLSPKDGSILWHNSIAISGRMPYAAAQIVNGVIYTSEYNLTNQNVKELTPLVQSQLTAYDAVSGQKLWQTPELTGAQPGDGFDPIVLGNLLYYQTQSISTTSISTISTLHAISIKNGSQVWSYQMSSDKGGMSAAVSDGNSVYFETSQLNGQQMLQHVVALNALTGAVRWSTPVQFQNGTESTPTPVSHDPNQAVGPTSLAMSLDIAPVVSNGTVYYSVSGNRAYALQASDGKVLAQFWVDKTSQTTVMNRMTFFSTP